MHQAFSKEAFYTLALSLIPGLGPVRQRQILQIYPSAYDFFYSTPHPEYSLLDKKKLPKFPLFEKDKALQKAESEIKWMQQNNVFMHCYADPNYPKLLKECTDSPLIMFVKSHAGLPPCSMLSFVGSRHASSYGLRCTENLIAELEYDPISIVSGLALGIDTQAHKSSLNHHIPTVAIFGQGLDKIYPSQNYHLAHEIVEQGGTLLSEMPSNTPMAAGLFPRRNRIIAGISEATVVVESSCKGGALITARLADSYNRSLFAFPGKIDMYYSQGCNYLIKNQMAHLIETAQDIRQELGWSTHWIPKPTETSCANSLSGIESKCLECIKRKDPASIDILCEEMEESLPEILSSMLHLELMGLVNCSAGNVYHYIKQPKQTISS